MLNTPPEQLYVIESLLLKFGAEQLKVPLPAKNIVESSMPVMPLVVQALTHVPVIVAAPELVQV